MTETSGVREGISQARARLLEAVRSGDWERVPSHVDAYGAAVRADERGRVLDDCLKALEDIFAQDQPESSISEWQAKCVAAMEGLR